MIQANKLTVFPAVIPISSNKAERVCVCLPALTLLLHMCYVTQRHTNEEECWIVFVLPRTETREAVFPRALLSDFDANMCVSESV